MVDPENLIQKSVPAPFELPSPSILAQAPRALRSGFVGVGASPSQALWLPSRLAPLSTDLVYVHAWFLLMRLTSPEQNPQGLTARQVARHPETQAFRGAEAAFLEHLVTVGDVVRRSGQAPRYVSLPVYKRLSWYVEQALSLSLETEPWGQFRCALQAHQSEGKQYTWNALREAFAALVASFPGWPDDVQTEARLHAERWLPRVAGVSPPVHLREEDELMRLREENALLHALLEQAQPAPAPVLPERSAEGGKKAELKRRLEELEAERTSLLDSVQELTWELDALEAELEAFARPDEMASAEAFLKGTGSGLLPHNVLPAELQRLRDLVAATRAPWALQRAMAAKLGTIYRTPLSFVRLTSQAFAGVAHPFDSLHRARVGGYRMGYGVARRVPTILHIGPRENFYATFLTRLEAWGARVRPSAPNGTDPSG